jgi:nicotinamide riboside transporter PnuC
MFLNHAYANATMLVIQAGVSTYGFFIWTQRRNHGFRELLLSMVYDRHHNKCWHQSVIATSRMTLKLHAYSLVAILLTSACAYFVLSVVDDIAPLTDALSFSVFLIAAIQLNYKKIESWLYYVVGDLLSMILACKANNIYNAIALFLFLVLNLICFRRWWKSMNKSH